MQKQPAERGKLAIEGGRPCVVDKPESYFHGSQEIGPEEIEAVKLQEVPDPEGDCAVSVVFFLDSTERAKWFAGALKAEGMSAGSIFDKGFPDRHIYYHWDYILEKRSPDRHGYPWTNPTHSCHIEYDPGMCPKTINYLSCAVAIPLTQTMSDAHVESCARAIRKVARHI